MSTFRYWRAHLANDPAAHWINVDCGKRVSESEAVRLIERAFPAERGRVTNALGQHSPLIGG